MSVIQGLFCSAIRVLRWAWCSTPIIIVGACYQTFSGQDLSSRGKRMAATEVRLVENTPSTHTSITRVKYLEIKFGTTIPAPVPPSMLYPDRPSLPVSPFDWTRQRKIFTTCISCAVTVVSGYASGSNNAAGPGMGADWHVSQTSLLIGTTTYCVGFAIAPMVLAPLSELKGRKPIFLFSGFVFAGMFARADGFPLLITDTIQVSQLGCAVTNSYGGLLVARFFAGVGSCIFPMRRLFFLAIPD